MNIVDNREMRVAQHTSRTSLLRCVCFRGPGQGKHRIRAGYQAHHFLKQAEKNRLLQKENPEMAKTRWEKYFISAGFLV
ncbi:hypothetical protein [Weizmannia acidilactici]|uniref:hypothetical protein n=1 Tax=Weizmannia acidilactici TaxID=2607726 RepID=UPI00124F3804|nr:hypothetical protein [Weizmannia acidilactici]